MKGLRTRLAAIWDLVCGRDFVLTAVHRRGNQYISTHRDCIDVPTYELAYKFIDTAIEHLDGIKDEVKRQENIKTKEEK